MIRQAEFSEDKTRRFVLTRIWDEKLPLAMCIGLNPSVAGSLKKDGTEKDDMTIRLLIKKLGELGFGGLKMCNLWTYITPKPKELFEKSQYSFEDDFAWLLTTAYHVQEIIFCWGDFERIEWRAKQVVNKFPNGKCFGKNPSGSPWHPRRMAYIKDHRPQLINYQ